MKLGVHVEHRQILHIYCSIAVKIHVQGVKSLKVEVENIFYQISQKLMSTEKNGTCKVCYFAYEE